MTSDARTRGTSFGREAAAYDAGRPEYPPASVSWTLPSEAVDVADIGAGTGKLTMALESPGRSVVAIDPDAGMLRSLVTRLPHVRTLVGAGESIPLDDASLDAAVFGQAWHWVNVKDATREVARVLRPGGTLGLIWNIRDESVPWVNELTGIMHGSPAEQLIASGGPRLGPGFTTLEVREERWSRPMSRDEVVAMATSRSYLIAAPAHERVAIIGEIRRLLETHPQLDACETIEMPYVTYAYRATRLE